MAGIATFFGLCFAVAMAGIQNVWLGILVMTVSVISTCFEQVPALVKVLLRGLVFLSVGWLLFTTKELGWELGILAPLGLISLWGDWK